MLDPTTEQIQQAKKQRARIYNDDIYYILGKPPENASEWTIDRTKYKHEGYKGYESEDDNDSGEGGDNEEDNEVLREQLDYILNSEEMNQLRPEDLSEQEECSTASTATVSCFL